VTRKDGHARAPKFIFRTALLRREMGRSPDTNRTTTAPVSADAKLQHLSKKLIRFVGIRSRRDK
jgi:hypothetical protein